MYFGRGDWIRTSDLPVPNGTLCQAEPRPEISFAHQLNPRGTRFLGPEPSGHFGFSSEQQIDFRPVLERELFGPLQNPGVFNAVTLDKEVGTVTSPNGADFDPSTLHDWPQVRDELVRMARRWADQTTGTQRTTR